MLKTKTIQVTPELRALLCEIDAFKGRWPDLQIRLSRRLPALQHAATIESVGASTRLESGTLTNREVELLLANEETRTFYSRDGQAVAGYGKVLDRILQERDGIPITENYIRQLHCDLLCYSEQDKAQSGQYRTGPLKAEAFDTTGQRIGAGSRTDDIPQRIAKLVRWLKDARDQKRLHPLLIVALFSMAFLEIHPFQDGNGRLSRILTTALLLQAGYAYVSCSSLESVMETSRENYHLALRQTQATLHTKKPDWQPWLLFFLQALGQQKRRLSMKIDPGQVASGDLSTLSVMVMAYVRRHGRATNRDLARESGAHPNSLKATFRSLVGQGLLVRYGKYGTTWYGLPAGADSDPDREQDCRQT